MEKIKVAFLLFILSFPLRNAMAGSPSLRDSVRNYYQLKNKAEMAIVEGRYSTAASLYSQAFLYKKSNPRDAYNAFVVYYKIGDSIDCKQCFDWLLMLGFPKKKLEWMPFIDSIKDQPVYCRFITKDTLKYYDGYLHSKISVYAHVLDSLYVADQAYRDHKSTHRVNYDSLNAAFVLNLSHRDIIPSIINVGYDDRFGMRPDREGTLFLLYWHWRGEKSPLDSLLKNAVLDGAFDPDDYAFQRDYGAHNKYYRQVINYNLSDLEPAVIKAINKQRREIYLAPLDEYCRKMEFSIQNETFAFFDQMLKVVNRQNEKSE